MAYGVVMSNYLMILNDGETYTNLEGCQIVAVPDDFDMEAVEEALSAYGRGAETAVKPIGAFDVYRSEFQTDHLTFATEDGKVSL